MCTKHPFRIGKLFFIALLLIPPACILYLISLYGMDVPFWDEWEFAVYLLKARAGALTLSDLWVHHNEHRLFFTRLILLAIACPTNWNIKCQLYANFVVATLAFVFIYLLLRSTFDKQVPSWLLVVISFLIFSPVQWENWAGGLVIHFFVNLVNITAAVYFMNRQIGRWTGLIIAIIFAVIASYTSAGGLLVWLAIVILFLQRGWRKEHFIVWIIAFAVATVLYFQGYTKPAHHPSPLFFISHPYEFAKYVFAYLGGSIARGWGTRGSVCIGIALLITISASAIYFKRFDKDGLNKLLPWLAIGAYGFLNAIVTGVGRAGFGVHQALASRYTTCSMLFVLSALVSVAFLAYRYRALNEKPLTKNIAVISSAVALISLLFALSFLQGIFEFKSRKLEIESAKACVKNFESADDECLQVYHPDAEHLRRVIKLLKETGLLEGIWWYRNLSK